MKNYDAWNLQILPTLPTDNRELLLHLVKWAVLAPSSHNAQPWRFELSLTNDLAIDILPVENEILPISDSSARQTYISIGCAIRNIIVAAKYYGFGLTISAGPSRGRYAARVKLFQDIQTFSARADSALMDAMIDRRMNRGKFIAEREVSASIIEAMRGPIDRDEKKLLTLDFISDALTKSAIAEIQYLADRFVVANNSFRKELANYILPNDSKEYRGMPGSTFGLSDEMTLRLCAELWKDGSFDPNLAVGFAAAGRDGIKSAPLIGVISCPSDDYISWINAGGLLQWIALIAEKYGLGLSVHAAMVEVELFNKLLKLRLGRSERPTVIFRLGYPIENRPHSPRVPAELVVFDGE